MSAAVDGKAAGSEGEPVAGYAALPLQQGAGDGEAAGSEGEGGGEPVAGYAALPLQHGAGDGEAAGSEGEGGGEPVAGYAALPAACDSCSEESGDGDGDGDDVRRGGGGGGGGGARGLSAAEIAARQLQMLEMDYMRVCAQTRPAAGANGSDGGGEEGDGAPGSSDRERYAALPGDGGDDGSDDGASVGSSDREQYAALPGDGSDGSDDSDSSGIDASVGSSAAALPCGGSAELSLAALVGGDMSPGRTPHVSARAARRRRPPPLLCHFARALPHPPRPSSLASARRAPHTTRPRVSMLHPSPLSPHTSTRVQDHEHNAERKPSLASTRGGAAFGPAASTTSAGRASVICEVRQSGRGTRLIYTPASPQPREMAPCGGLVSYEPRRPRPKGAVHAALEVPGRVDSLVVFSGVAVVSSVVVVV